ncbi:retrovirus-related pol polyprotein from transposon TNT 1-94 [Tanacetum coccineum]
MITQPTDVPSRNNTKVSESITESLVLDVTQCHISNQAFTSSHPIPQDRWSRDKHIKLVNIISDPGKGMLTRSMAAKLTAASASEYLFADILFVIENKKFYRNKVWTLVPLPYGKIAIGSKWVFKNKKDKHGTTTKNITRLVAQGYSQEEGIYYDKTFAPPPGFESSEFPDYVCKLDKTLYRLKQAPRACSLVKTPMVPPNNLGPDLAGKPVNETSYRGMIGSLMYLTTTRPDI